MSNKNVDEMLDSFEKAADIAEELPDHTGLRKIKLQAEIIKHTTIAIYQAGKLSDEQFNSLPSNNRYINVKTRLGVCGQDMDI